MPELDSWGLAGYGNIGKEVVQQISQPEVAKRLGLNPLPEFVLRSSGLKGPDGETPNLAVSLNELPELPDVTFIAVPSTEDGSKAFSLINTILGEDKKVVTAEKGALANYFSTLEEVSDRFNNLGINATVGGGTRMMEVFQVYSQDPENISQVHLVVNGTLTAILSSIGPKEGKGISLGQAAAQAKSLGYSEPGAESPYDVIRMEATSDVPKKAAIFFNVAGLSDEILGWEDLQFDLSDDEISGVVEEAKVRRFAVSIYSEKHAQNHKCPENDIIGGFEVEHDGWKIVGGFRHMEYNPLFSDLYDLSGPGNGFVVGLGTDEKDGVYPCKGPGAGPSPTVNTMLDDYQHMRG